MLWGKSDFPGLGSQCRLVKSGWNWREKQDGQELRATQGCVRVPVLPLRHRGAAGDDPALGTLSGC